MNACLDAKIGESVCATGRKKIVIAGLWTEACVIIVYARSPEENLCRCLWRCVARGVRPRYGSPSSGWRRSDHVATIVFEFQQDWARSETWEGVMGILPARSLLGMQVRFS